MKNREKIGFREDQYNLHQETETKLFAIADEIKSMIPVVLGEDYKLINLEPLLKDTFDFLVWEFWALNKHLYPTIADPVKTFTSVSPLSQAQIQSKCSSFWKLHKDMGEHAPTIGQKALKSTLKKDAFNLYLDEDKREHYEALKRFIDASDELRKMGKASGSINLIRFTHNTRLTNSGGVQIELHKFI